MFSSICHDFLQRQQHLVKQNLVLKSQRRQILWQSQLPSPTHFTYYSQACLNTVGLESENLKLNSEVSSLSKNLQVLENEKAESSTENNQLKTKLEEVESGYKIKLSKSDKDLLRLKCEVHNLQEEVKSKQILMTM